MRLTMFDRPQYYVSLGDSISIDAYAGGSGRGAASLLFRNRNEDFSDWQGRDLETKIANCRLIPLAMDGATVSTVRYVQLPRLLEMGAVPSLVTLTMGGNDLVQCWMNDEAAEQANRMLHENGSAILTILRNGMQSDAPILLGTIYDPSDATGDTSRLQFLRWPNALHWLGSFNATLRNLAKEHGALLTDIHAHFQGHGLSVGDPTQGESRPADRALWYCGTIEPNAWGAHGLRTLWWQTLLQAGWVTD